MSGRLPAFAVFPPPEVQRTMPGRRVRDRLMQCAAEDRERAGGTVRSAPLTPTAESSLAVLEQQPDWLSQPGRATGR